MIEAVQLAAFLARAAGEGAARGRGTARPRVECARAAHLPRAVILITLLILTSKVRYTCFCINVTTVAPTDKIVCHRHIFHPFQSVYQLQLIC